MRRLVDLLVTGLIDGTARAAAESGVRNVDELRRYGSRIAAFTPESSVANRELKRFLHCFVYSSEALATERRRARDPLSRDPEAVHQVSSAGQRLQVFLRLQCHRL